MEMPFVRQSPGDNTPCHPWLYVTEAGWCVLRIVPMHTIETIKKGKMSPEVISLMINVCATAIILNRIMGRPDFHGVPKFRGF